MLLNINDTIWPKKGFLVCNSNCAVIGMVIPFAAILEKFGPVDPCRQ
jgi:aspartate-semialdehyde dehydrogenase